MVCMYQIQSGLKTHKKMKGGPLLEHYTYHGSQLIHYVMHNARVYADNSIRILNVKCIAMCLGWDFSNLIILAQVQNCS